MIVVGITGGIGSGKSTISKFLKKKNFALHDSDTVVKNLYSKPPIKFLNHLKKIGLKHTLKTKKINKKKIREEIFNNKFIKKKLEKFIHNEVKKSRNEFLKRNRKNKSKIVILDIPLLFEAKLTNLCDYVILLYSPHKIRFNRVIRRKGMNKDILLKIFKNQIKDSYKKKLANYVINTSAHKQKTFEAISKALYDILIKNA